MGMGAGGLPLLPPGPAWLSLPLFPERFRTGSKLARSLWFSQRRPVSGSTVSGSPAAPWRALGVALEAVAADASETSCPPRHALEARVYWQVWGRKGCRVFLFLLLAGVGHSGPVPVSTRAGTRTACRGLGLDLSVQPPDCLQMRRAGKASHLLGLFPVKSDLRFSCCSRCTSCVSRGCSAATGVGTAAPATSL